MKTTKILPCSCPHDDQDRIYGKQRRVHNATYGSGQRRPQGWRCTVCGDEKVIHQE